MSSSASDAKKIGAITPPVTPSLEKPGIIVSESEVPKIIAMAIKLITFYNNLA
jgi:hypothetical protein